MKRLLSWTVLITLFAAMLWVLTRPPKLPEVDALIPPALPVGMWDGQRAMRDIETQVSFGRRSIGTEGHDKTIAFIKSELAKTNARVETQVWTDQGITFTNIIARFEPHHTRRILIGTHYDSVVRAWRDKENPDAVMPGANNSASGVALLLETARAIYNMPISVILPLGVDLVFFDGEEGPKALGSGDKEWVALGSLYFAKHLKEWYPKDKPEAAAIFDMVCYRDFVAKPELVSLKSAPMEAAKFWHFGRRIKPEMFSTEIMPYSMGDDHIALKDAGIPSFLVIGYEYDPWYNTTQDTPDKCSSETLEVIGQALLDYIYSKEK